MVTETAVSFFLTVTFIVKTFLSTTANFCDYFLALDPHGQDHVGIIKFFISGGQHDGTQAVGQLQHHFFTGNHSQSIGKISYIQANFQILAVTGNGAAVFCGTDGGICPQLDNLITENATYGGLWNWKDQKHSLSASQGSWWEPPSANPKIHLPADGRSG